MAHETTRSHSAWDENTKLLLNSRASLAFGTAGTGAVPWRQFALRLCDSRDLSRASEQSELGNLEKLSALCFSLCLTLVWCRNTPRRQVTQRQHLLGLPFIPLLQCCLRKAFPNIGKKLQTGRCLCVADEGFLNLLNLFEGGAKTLHQEPVPSREEPQSRGKSLARKTARMTPSASILVWKFFDFLWLGFQAA